MAVKLSLHSWLTTRGGIRKKKKKSPVPSYPFKRSTSDSVQACIVNEVLVVLGSNVCQIIVLLHQDNMSE